MSYEVNQLFIAESFQALYVDNRGRPTLTRGQLQARQELCEDIAQSLAEVCLGLRFKTDASSDEALSRCHEGLLTPESALPAPEARWIAVRIAELLQWDVPEFLHEYPSSDASD